MLKVLGSLLVASLCVGCLSKARPALVEAPDPIIGDLRCARPRISLLEALHYQRAATPVPQDCDSQL